MNRCYFNNVQRVYCWSTSFFSFIFYISHALPHVIVANFDRHVDAQWVQLLVVTFSPSQLRPQGYRPHRHVFRFSVLSSSSRNERVIGLSKNFKVSFGTEISRRVNGVPNSQHFFRKNLVRGDPFGELEVTRGVVLGHWRTQRHRWIVSQIDTGLMATESGYVGVLNEEQRRSQRRLIEFAGRA